MNLSPSWVELLTRAGEEAVHWSRVGAANASDRELMQWAAEHGYVVLTADLDFAAILAATGRHRPSVVQLRSDLLTPDAVGTVVLSAFDQLRSELAAGAIISIDAARARIRLLPLHEDEP
jgi:predicted nuclease of predicted toxin-antitoxin system